MKKLEAWFVEQMRIAKAQKGTESYKVQAILADDMKIHGSGVAMREIPHDYMEGLYVYYYLCPSCDIRAIVHKHKFCPMCGERLIWPEEKEKEGDTDEHV